MGRAAAGASTANTSRGVPGGRWGHCSEPPGWGPQPSLELVGHTTPGDTHFPAAVTLQTSQVLTRQASSQPSEENLEDRKKEEVSGQVW